MLEGVTKGKIKKPILAIVYGKDGIGKSTFGADAPNPIFIGAEDGTANLDTSRFSSVNSYAELIGKIRLLRDSPHDYKTVILDSLDWAEPLVWKTVCEKHKVDSIEDIGYNKGYVFALNPWAELRDALRELREKRGMNVIILAHCMVKSFNDPTQLAPYDRYQLKLHDKAAAMWREFVDAVLFATFEVMVVKDKETKKSKAIGEGKRVLFTQQRPTFDAKNRLGLPHELPLQWSAFMAAVDAGNPDSLESIRADIVELSARMPKDGTLEKMEIAIKAAGDDVTTLIKIRNYARVIAGE